MKHIHVGEQEAGQRLDKLLARYLKEAPPGFLYKMLRKKNITLNGKKAAGSEKVQTGDEVRIFLSDETYEKFAGASFKKESVYPVTELEILYEDDHILLINKPSGMLTQKAKPSDVSLNEYMLGYLKNSGQWSEDNSAKVRPSVCNRLDRNTSGIVLCGKSLAGLQQISELLKNRDMHKYYQCLVKGRLEASRRIEGYLWKDVSANQVRILDAPKEEARPIVTEYRPLKVSSDHTLLEVRLITGRSHQIRAHLASEGHPIIGDYKYGDKRINDEYRRKYRIESQLLHAWRVEFPELTGALAGVSEQTFTAALPPVMKKDSGGKLEFMSTWNTRGLRGSTLEDMINRTNERYREKGLALIQKVPTPITPIKIDKEHRHITLAYFEQKSTVDYIGAVQGIPVCFDAKECNVRTFPLHNVHEHQVKFMTDFESQGGKAFLIIHYTAEQKFYYLHIRQLLTFWERAKEGGRKSFRMEELAPEYFFETGKGFLVPYLEPLSRDLEQS